MTRVVESVIHQYGDILRWSEVAVGTLEGAKRFLELSNSLGHPAPIPSIFIDGELLFDKIPDPDELKHYLDKVIEEEKDFPIRGS